MAIWITTEQRVINLGTAENNGSGDSLRDGGSKINQNFTDLYAAVNTIPSQYILPRASNTVLGGVKIDGTSITITNDGVISAATVLPANTNPLIDGITASIGTSVRYARADHVHPAISVEVIPLGVIVMWSGTVNNIPSGWQLCDGTNNTPDLRNRFVIGAGSTYQPRATGGSADSIVPSHSHTATFTGTAMGTHTHTVTDPGHSHVVTGQAGLGAPSGGATIPVGYGSSTVENTLTSVTGITIAGASAGTPAGTVTVSSTGNSSTNANLPPYLALAYIMKIN